MSNLICIAKITAAHGIKGAVRIRVFTDDITKYKQITDSSGSKVFKLRVQSELPRDFIIAAIEGVTTRNAAEELKNCELFVDSKYLPSPEKGEFYINDLIGLGVINKEGEILGNVMAVHNFGAGDILEIKFDNKKTSELLRFSRLLFPEIDLQNKTIQIDWNAY